MRKSFKRIVSSVIAATMVLTSCVVSNISFATAADSVDYGTLAEGKTEFSQITGTFGAGEEQAVLPGVSAYSSGSGFDIKTGTKTGVDGTPYTQWIQVGKGNKSVDATATTVDVAGLEKYLGIYTSGAGTLTIDHFAGSSNVDGSTVFFADSTGAVQTFITDNSKTGVATVNVAAAGKYYLFAPGNTTSLNVLALTFTASADQPAPGPDTSDFGTLAEGKTEFSQQTGTFGAGEEQAVGTIPGVTAYSSGSGFDIKTGTKTGVDGTPYTQWIQVGKGNKSVDATATTVDVAGLEKYLGIYTSGAGTLTIDHFAGSSNVDGSTVFFADSTGAVQTFITDNSKTGVATVNVAAAGKYYLFAPGNTTSLNVLALTFTASGDQPAPETTTNAPAEETSAETTTNAPAEETSAETTTSAPAEETSAETTTEAPAPGPGVQTVGSARIYPVVGEPITDALTGEVTYEVEYKIDLKDGASFNHYTLYLDFAKDKLIPNDAKDGDISLRGTDATGNAVLYKASNAENIKAQFDVVPKADDPDYNGLADGSTPAKELGRIKIAFVISDEAFGNISGNLPGFTTSGTLFTIQYKVKENADPNGSIFSVDAGTLSSVSQDQQVNSKPESVTDSTDSSLNKDIIGIKGYIDNVETDPLEIKISEANANGITITYKSADANKENNLVLGSFDGMLNFDATKLQLTAVEYGDKFTKDGRDDGIHTELSPNGMLNYAAAQSDPDYADGNQYHIVGVSRDGIQGGETIVKATFKLTDQAKAGDTYVVTLKPKEAGDLDGTIVNLIEEPYTIILVDELTPGPEESTEKPSEGSTEQPTEGSTSEQPSEGGTEQSTEGSSSEQPSQGTTAEQPSEATTAKPGSGTGGGGGGGAGGKGPNKGVTTTEAAVEATTSSRPSVDVDEGIGFKPPVDKIPGFTGFVDLGNYPWAEDAINRMAELGIIKGIGDNMYGPALPCRRADFAILINRMLGLDVNSRGKNFSDNEDTGKYYYNDLITGYNAGILEGYGDNNYKPENYATREEVACLIARTYEWLGYDVRHTDLSVNDKYSDVADIAFWSAPYVAFLTDEGVFAGNADGTFLPKNDINRAEIALVISRMYDDALDVYNDRVAEAEAKKAAEATTEAATEATTEAAETTTEEAVE